MIITFRKVNLKIFNLCSFEFYMSLLITGSSGFIGTNLVKYLDKKYKILWN